MDAALTDRFPQRDGADRDADPAGRDGRHPDRARRHVRGRARRHDAVRRLLRRRRRVSVGQHRHRACSRPASADMLFGADRRDRDDALRHRAHGDRACREPAGARLHQLRAAHHRRARSGAGDPYSAAAAGADSVSRRHPGDRHAAVPPAAAHLSRLRGGDRDRGLPAPHPRRPAAHRQRRKSARGLRGRHRSDPRHASSRCSPAARSPGSPARCSRCSRSAPSPTA